MKRRDLTQAQRPGDTVLVNIFTSYYGQNDI